MSYSNDQLGSGNVVVRTDTGRVGVILELLESYHANVQWLNGTEEPVPLSLLRPAPAEVAE